MRPQIYYTESQRGLMWERWRLHGRPRGPAGRGHRATRASFRDPDTASGGCE